MADDRYLIESYSRASNALEKYETDYDNNKKHDGETALQEAARSLCEGLSKLGGDADFWGNLQRMMSEAKRHRSAIDRALDDLESFSELENRVFENSGLSRKERVRLFSDMDSAIQNLKRTLSPADLQRLKRGLGDTTRAVCELSRHADHKGWFGRGFLTVRKGVRVLGGAVTIVTNFVTLPATGPIGYLSVVVGVSMLADSVEFPKQ